MLGTQSIEDAYKNDASKAAYNNADWKLILRQDKQKLDNLIREGLASFTPAVEKMIRSLQKEDGQFSEMIIDSPDGQMRVRHIPDPFALLVATSTGEEYVEERNHLIAQGYSHFQALELMLERRRRGLRHDDRIEFWPDGAHVAARSLRARGRGGAHRSFRCDAPGTPELDERLDGGLAEILRASSRLVTGDARRDQPLLYTVISHRVPPVATVDLQKLVESAQARQLAVFRSTHSAQAAPSASDAQAAVNETGRFARDLSVAVDSLGQSCHCVLINKAAILNTESIIDYTDVLRARLKLDPPAGVRK
ncbi:IncF plasmid conjugative transfer pilus assembly protein TraC [Candidatus Burkholderia pumila]|uniref:IncF plasmid conjugative transfer pilus assembly protein TraC n=1 Tax=Candidatus Burkholderia pumila TaxID=1090375 RepID=A0ABR5HPJ6_9BURK|nr:IncF plasmid conjugative transfer pilus assembly protein TraC [Candidatus Burkholderia pumila]